MNDDFDKAEQAEMFIHKIAEKKGVKVERSARSPMAESMSGKQYWINRPIPFTREEISELQEIWAEAEITFDGDQKGDVVLVSKIDIMPDAPFVIFEVAAKPANN